MINDLIEYESRLLDYIERGGTPPKLPDPLLDRIVDPERYDLVDEDEA